MALGKDGALSLAHDKLEVFLGHLAMGLGDAQEGEGIPAWGSDERGGRDPPGNLFLFNKDRSVKFLLGWRVGEKRWLQKN